ncbi:MAG: tyrosine-type recombinase/integrase [Succinivibrio sp.]
MKKITAIEFQGKNKKGGLLKECIDKAVNEHKQVHKGLGGGLELLVLKNTGAATFRYKSIRLGAVNRMTLGDAFKRVEELKRADELKKKKQDLLNSSVPKLKDFFLEWIEEKAASFKPGSSRKNNILALYRHTLYPLYDYRLCELTASLVYKNLSAINQTAGNKHNAVNVLNQCLDNATIKGIIDQNPISKVFSGSENPFKKQKTVGYKTVDAESLKEKYFVPLKDTPLLNRTFYLFIALTAFRFNECRLMKWSWIDFDKNMIVIPPNAVGANKTQKDLVKPMTHQIRTLLNNWKVYSDPNSDHVFKRSKQDLPISEASLRDPMKFLTSRELDFHGIRKSLKTWLVSEGCQNEFISELALTHDVRSSLQKTYDKYNYIQPLLEALQQWNDYIETMLPDEFLELLKNN